MADLNNVRIQHTHATEAEWNKKENGVPKKGEFIVYDPDDTHLSPRFKIGDGVKTIKQLSFVESGSAGSGDVTAAGDNTFTGKNSFEAGKIQFKGKNLDIELYPNANALGALNASGTATSIKYHIASEDMSNTFTEDNTFNKAVIFGETATLQKKVKKGTATEDLNFTFPEAGGTLATAKYVDDIVGDIQTLLADLNGGNGVS